MLAVTLAALAVVLLAELGWAYRVFRPVPAERRLPSPHVRLAWIRALLLGGVLLALPSTLDTLLHGPPAWVRALLVVHNANLVLGLAVPAFALQQWIRGYGTRAIRARYAVVAAASLWNLWLAWSFGLVGAGM